MVLKKCVRFFAPSFLVGQSLTPDHMCAIHLTPVAIIICNAIVVIGPEPVRGPLVVFIFAETGNHDSSQKLGTEINSYLMSNSMAKKAAAMMIVTSNGTNSHRKAISTDNVLTHFCTLDAVDGSFLRGLLLMTTLIPSYFISLPHSPAGAPSLRPSVPSLSGKATRL